jgi:hypothetical protein
MAIYNQLINSNMSTFKKEKALCSQPVPFILGVQGQIKSIFGFVRLILANLLID